MEQIKVTTLDATFLGKPHNVILFNDNTHTQIEVISQIIKAIHCSRSKAEIIMTEAEKTGKAIVITTNKERCELVGAILEEIKLMTKIEPT